MIPVAALLGDASYAVYALHMPIAHWAHAVAMRGLLPTWAALGVFLVLTFGIAVAAVRYWDVPARKWLSAQLALRRSALPQQI